MGQLLRVETVPQAVAEEDDPFRYGWRYVRRPQSDGTEVVDQIPLTLEDLLYPEEDDFVVQEPVHTRDFVYCHTVLETFYAADPSVVVLGDCRVDWGVEGVRPLGPDILVLFEVHQWLRRATFHLAEEGGQPALVLEIVSPSTRVHDLGAKLNLYYRVGVQKYVLVDRGPQGDDPVRVFGYQRGPTGWLSLPLNARGQIDLTPVGLLLGIAENRPWLYNAMTGAREPDRTELRQALTNAEARAREEAQARAALEERVRALEAQLRRQQGEEV